MLEGGCAYMHMMRGYVILGDSLQATPPAGVYLTYLLDLVHFEGIEKEVREIICNFEKKSRQAFAQRETGRLLDGCAEDDMGRVLGEKGRNNG